ncbi:MAG: phage tail tape measure protein, partial [Gammaproteobacteria bacterium]|nr:phage tail tape measure protein [Gammaproteobacteria bacterium]
MVDIVEVGLAVDSTQVDKGKARLKKLGDQARKTEKATDKMSRAFKTGMVAAMAAATVAVFSAIKAHREFTKSISELSSITGAVGKDLEFFKNQSLQLGESTTFSASQVATAFKLIASAKPDLLESKEALALVTREVLTLAEASGLDLPQAANALGGALNQFSAGASEANRFINVLAAGSKFGASAINETSEAMKNVGAVASSMGLSFESTNAAIQALASVSIKGTEAGTGLRGVLLKLAKQSRDEFNPEIVGLEQAMKNLKDANLTTTEKMNLFGLESTTAATALIAQADSIGILTEKLTGTGVAMEQAAINTNNLDGDIKMMSSAWEGAALFIGDMFDHALRAVVQTMGGAAKIIKSIGIAIKDMGDALGWFMAATAAVLTLDFDALDKINETRDKNAQKLKDEYDLIWNINGALDAKKEKEEAILAAKGEELAKEDQAAAGEKEAERLAAAMQASKLLREQEASEKEEDRIDMLFRDAEYNEEKVARESEARELRLEAEREEKELMLAEKQDYWDRLYNMQTGS